MKIVAVGRVCIDEFYTLRSHGNRIESTKVAADYQGRQLGGSIYNSLKILAEAKNDCHIICSGFQNSIENDYLLSCFRNHSINYHVVPKKGSMRSIILMSDKQELLSVISINETEDQLITSDDLNRFNSWTIDDIYYLMVDLRQKHAAKALIDSIKQPLRRIVLDPGTSIAFRAECDLEYHKHITSHSHIIIASKDFYDIFGCYKKLTDYLSLEIFKQARLLICNLPNGECVVATPFFCFTVLRKNYDLHIGNTLGAGDAFRGAFLASFADSSFNDKHAIINAVKFAIASATLKVEDTHLFPVMPSFENILKKAEMMSFEHKTTDYLT